MTNKAKDATVGFVYTVKSPFNNSHETISHVSEPCCTDPWGEHVLKG